MSGSGDGRLSGEPHFFQWFEGDAAEVAKLNPCESTGMNR